METQASVHLMQPLSRALRTATPRTTLQQVSCNRSLTTLNFSYSHSNPLPPSATYSRPTQRHAPRSQRLHQRSQKRTLISAPTPTSGPIMERRPDRALPDVYAARRRWLLTVPVFALLVGTSALAIFNYEKSSSSVVASTLYSLRTHPLARELLGDEVYFRDRFPWIWGELNQVHGRIDIGYGVKGTRGRGFMRFKAVRRSRMALFETVDWTLELEDGTMIKLLDTSPGGNKDPFSREVQEAQARA